MYKALGLLGAESLKRESRLKAIGILLLMLILFSSQFQPREPTSRFRKWQMKTQPYILLSTGIRLRLSIAAGDLLGKSVKRLQILCFNNHYLVKTKNNTETGKTNGLPRRVLVVP